VTILDRPNELPLPGKIALASDDLGWNDVVVRSYEYGASDIELPPMRDYMLVAYHRGITTKERCLDGHWSRELLAPGSVQSKRSPSIAAFPTRAT
jgi:AraC family transcriptional regulator